MESHHESDVSHMKDSNGDGGELPGPRRNSKQGPRKRVSQACDRCRSRKDKCDGVRPSCTTCITNGRQCAYEANVKKRGLPEGYVRGMEKLWGIAISEVQGVDDSLMHVIRKDEENDGFLSIWNDESNSESLVESWRKSQVSRELEILLSATETGKRRRTESESQMGKRIKTDEAPGAYAGDGLGLPATWTERRFDKGPQNEYQDSMNLPRFYANDQLTNENYKSILSPAKQANASVSPAADPTPPTLPSEAWHLLDVYFSYTHPWFPIIEKHDLLRTSYQYAQNNQIPLAGRGSGNHAALWATIAYAKYQHRAINNIPHAQGLVADMVWTAERIYAQARKLIPTEEGFFEIGHVQAILILALVNMGIGHSSRAWLLIGQAVRLALDLRLNRTSEDIMAVLQSKSRNKHVFLGCFALDTIIAARLGYRPHLRTEDVELVGFLEVDGLEEWDPWTDCLSARRSNSGNIRGPASILSTFNRLIQVLQILNEATCITHLGSRLQHSTLLLEKLHIWSQSQTTPLYFDSTAMKSDQTMLLLPHHHHLHLAYFNTLVTSQLLSYDHGQNSSNLEPCTRPARHIADLLKQHSRNFGLLIVPPSFEYFTKTAYDVVREVNSSLEHTRIVMNDWKHSLDDCLDAMGPAWPTFESLKDSVSLQSHHLAPSGRRQSQVAYDLISGITQPSDVSIASDPQSAFASGETLNARAGRPPTSQPVNTPRPNQVTASPISHRTGSFDQSSTQFPPNFQQSLQPVFQPSNTWPPQKPLLLNSRPRLSIGSTPDLELDPMFQEFAALDATKWTNNWDKSLANLGFTDPDNMNQDFINMSQEPDPLFPNNIFQQLVANSNADVFDGNMLGMGFGFGDGEGIEACQILQALSKGDDQRSDGRKGPNG